MNYISTNQLKTLRIVSGEYFADLDVNNFIQEVENQFDIDITSISGWQQAIKRIQDSKLEYNKKILNHKLRKALIIQKLLNEFRPSPFLKLECPSILFSGTEGKTASALREYKRRSKTVVKNTSEKSTPSELSTCITAENVSADNISEKKISFDVSEDLKTTTTSEKDKKPNTNISEQILKYKKHFLENPLPPHNTISSMTRSESNDIASLLPRSSIHTKIDPIPHKVVSDTSDMIQPRSPKDYKIEVSPETITLTDPTFQEQSLIFTLKNCGPNAVYVQFKSLSNSAHFETHTVLPDGPIKLYTGIVRKFQLTLKLQAIEKNDVEFSSHIRFRIGYSNSPKMYLDVPIVSKFKQSNYRSAYVDSLVFIPPVYTWQIDNQSGLCGFPSKNVAVSISIDDSHSYYLHIIKSEENLLEEDFGTENISNKTQLEDDLSLSVNASSTLFLDKTLSLITENISGSKISIRSTVKRKRSKNKRIGTQSDTQTQFLADAAKREKESRKEITKLVQSCVNEILNNALETFIFNKTCLLLEPGSSKCIRVFFTKPERIGFHNGYFWFKFYDTKTDELVLLKKTHVFAEILPHPLQVSPHILICQSLDTHGYYKDTFFVTNSHKVYNIDVRIEMTDNMKELFKITPMQSVVVSGRSAQFTVSYCKRSWSKINAKKSVRKSIAPVKDSENLAYCVIKLAFSGPVPIFGNITPIFYEIIIPCIDEFDRVYGQNFVID